MIMSSMMNLTRTVNMPNVVMKLMNEPGTSKTISTRSEDGTIHTIYMGSMTAFSADQICMAHVLMKRSQQNLIEMEKSGDPISISITNGMASYEVMAQVNGYQTSGQAFDMMIDALQRPALRISSISVG